MLPYYVVILPLWICVAIVFPLVQTLHSLQEESAERKVWLFYWCLYCAASFALYCFEWLISIPFYVISFYVDIYYETQLLMVVYLVHPKTMGIRTLQAFLESKSHELLENGTELGKGYAKIAYDKFLEVTRPS
mmetsp:Transcript_35928/g.82849  ORF Transcript_35928/g.82849 Transcript_35928/m.82849 type:complete len:133 (-) Transcript_35928:151-549(-)